MNGRDNGKTPVDSATAEPVHAVKNGSFGRAERMDIRISHALGIYLLFMFAVYWPVFLGRRFFWEDFAILDFPARDFAYYMAVLKHALPFWNPYNWAWSSWLADPQTAFWYPSNLLQIGLATIFQRGALHPSIRWPEIMTIFHLPLAATGMFVLLRKEFKVAGLVALLAGMTFGFGLHMAADQNHPAKIIQLSLLPWETLLLMRSWRLPRFAPILGIVLGISFLAGQPQVFFFISFFLGSFTVAEVLMRRKERGLWQNTLAPVAAYVLAVVIAAGVASIQLLPSLELANSSARIRMSFSEASYGGIHLGHLINFVVPKFYGEFPGYTASGASISPHNKGFWYWEAAYYWGMLPEILAIVAAIVLWKRRLAHDPKTRYLFFAVIFSAFALAFGLGKNLYLQWIFWKFVPMFDRFRAPNRMIWFLWFLGSIYSAIGLELFLNAPRTHVRLLLKVCSVFVVINLLAISGIFDLLFPPHLIRPDVWRLMMPSFVLSLLLLFLFLLVRRDRISRKALTIVVSLIIVGDLFYVDFSWHRNQLDQTQVSRAEANMPMVQALAQEGKPLNYKLLWRHSDSTLQNVANLGTFLRLPVEDVQDSLQWTAFNPVRPLDPFPLIQDSTQRMEIMGVSRRIALDGSTNSFLHALPFVKLYYRWSVASTDSEASKQYNDSGFNFQSMILLDRSPGIPESEVSIHDTARMTKFSENYLTVSVLSEHPAILLVNDLYSPSWHAVVDGRETPVFRGFTTLRAICIPAGTHTVEMHYDSHAFNIGWKITLGTMVIAFIVFFLGKKQKGPDNNRGPSELK